MIVQKERADRRFNSVNIKRICQGLICKLDGSPPKKSKQRLGKLTLWAKPKEFENKLNSLE